MAQSLDPTNPELRQGLYRLYRTFFDKAERNRRWTLAEDIPWDQANRNMHPAIADVVESFCAVEMYLPDYVAKALPMIRANKGWAWFHVNWGYEEAKHSLALGDWLLRSGVRSEEQMADMEDRVFAHEWNLPVDSPHGMLIYAMVQELATWVNYRNLGRRVDEHGGDPALSRLLTLITIDERAHHTFYRQIVQLFLQIDRQETLEQLRRVLTNFSMPAVHLLADSRQREVAIRDLGIFDESIFREDVFHPLLQVLGLSARDLRHTERRRKSMVERPIPGTVAGQ